MPLSVHQSSVAVFEVMLKAFSAILDKALAHAEAHKFDPTVYMTMRLRPDMLPFGRQVMIVCDNAKNVPSRLAGVQAPVFEDNETTLDQLKARIQRTLDYLETLNAKAFAADFRSKSRNTPFDGWTLTGGPVATWVGGRRIDVAFGQRQAEEHEHAEAE